MSAPVRDARHRAIGDRIREARMQKDLTQKKLAELMGDLSRSAIAQWENGFASPSIEDVLRLSEILGTDPAFLAFGRASVGGMQAIPLVEYKVSPSGFAVRTKTVDEVPMDSRFFKRLQAHVSRSSLKATIAQTSAGTVNKGDQILFDTSDTAGDVPGTYLVWDDEPVLAEVSPTSDGKVRARIRQGQEVELAATDLHILGRVIETTSPTGKAH